MFIIFIILLFVSFQILGKFEKLPTFLQQFYDRQEAASRNVDEIPTINQIGIWKRGTKRNFAEVHIYLAGWLMQMNRTESKAKIQYVHSYLARFFRGEGVFSQEMSAALRYETDVKSMYTWVNSKMKDREQKVALLNFLIALSLVDGDVVKNEFDALVNFGASIGFERLVVEGMINQQSSNRRQKEQSDEIAYVSRETLRMQSLKILEISGSAGTDEIKKAYRKLVKQYHPDRQQSVGTKQQEYSTQKFREIQQAYDYLMENI